MCSSSPTCQIRLTTPPPLCHDSDSLEHCNRRLKGFSLAEGFDIVRKGGGTKVNPAYRFSCYYHGDKTRNDRKLEDSVKYDENSRITSDRQLENTTFRQLNYA